MQKSSLHRRRRAQRNQRAMGMCSGGKVRKMARGGKTRCGLARRKRG